MKRFFLFLLGFCVALPGPLVAQNTIFGSGLNGGSVPATCDADLLATFEARAGLLMQREVSQAQGMLLKPDSVMEYTCFDQFVSNTAETADTIFSDNLSLVAAGGSGGSGGGLSGGLGGIGLGSIANAGAAIAAAGGAVANAQATIANAENMLTEAGSAVSTQAQAALTQAGTAVSQASGIVSGAQGAVSQAVSVAKQANGALNQAQTATGGLTGLVTRNLAASQQSLGQGQGIVGLLAEAAEQKAVQLKQQAIESAKSQVASKVNDALKPVTDTIAKVNNVTGQVASTLNNVQNAAVQAQQNLNNVQNTAVGAQRALDRAQNIAGGVRAAPAQVLQALSGVNQSVAEVSGSLGSVRATAGAVSRNLNNMQQNIAVAGGAAVQAGMSAAQSLGDLENSIARAGLEASQGLGSAQTVLRQGAGALNGAAVGVAQNISQEAISRGIGLANSSLARAGGEIIETGLSVAQNFKAAQGLLQRGSGVLQGAAQTAVTGAIANLSGQLSFPGGLGVEVPGGFGFDSVPGGFSVGGLGDFSSGNLGNLSLGNLGNLSPGNLGNLSPGNLGNLSLGNLGNLSSGNLGNLSPGNLGNLSPGNLGNLSPGNLGNLSPGNLGASFGGGFSGFGGGGSIPSAPQIEFDTVASGLVSKPVQDYTKVNFKHSFLGGTSDEDHTFSGSVASSNTYNCDKMNIVWETAKCTNFQANEEQHGFITLEDFASGDPDVRSTETAACDKQDFALLYEVSQYRPAESLETHIDLIDSKQCAKAPLIKTGVKFLMTSKSGKGSAVAIDDAVCVAPGCYYDGKGKCL